MRDPSPNQIETLAACSLQRLRATWQEVSGRPAPDFIGREFLRAMVAWHWQAQAHGGLTHWTQQQLARGGQPSAVPPISPPPLPLGTVLCKIYQGRRYAVTVQADGFAFEGIVYASLSEIARRITGTRWNGPAFFGLRRQTRTPNRKDTSQ